MQIAKTIILFLGILLINFSGHAQTTSWWEQSPWNDPDRGFHWYPDPLAPAPPPKETKKEPEKVEIKPIEKIENMDELRKEILRLKDIAVMNPTAENVKTYLSAQTYLFDKSSMFADVARRVVWSNPEIDYSARSPVTNFAAQNQRARQANERENTIDTLKETHGILFFTRSDCDFCKDQATVLKAFSNKTGMPILAISMDGGPIQDFPSAQKDNGISKVASGGQGISIVPAIFLVEKSTNAITPLGSGVIAADEIAERIRVMVNTTPGQEF